MPSPVTFDVSTSSLPAGWKGDPQALNQAIAERLVVTPSEPWSSFVRGSVAPTSDVGPWLTDEGEWKVWSTEAGAYVPLVVDGGAVKDASVAVAALAAVQAKAVLVSDADGKVSTLTGTAGQVLEVDAAGKPAFVTPQVSFFDVTLSVDQTYPSDETQQIVNFDTVVAQGGVAFDTAGHKLPVPAGSVWWVSLRLQVENTSGNAVQVQHNAIVEAVGLGSIGGLKNYSDVMPRDGVNVSGLLYVPSASHLVVKLSTVCNPSVLTGFKVAANSVNTRFSGFRIL
jgi:hypothetical protein